jgi:hypothetical protein
MTLPIRSCLAAVVAGAFLAACATAPDAAPAKSAELTEGAIAPDGSVVKCRKVEVIGSRFPERTCKSETAWAAFDEMMAKSAKEQTNKIQSVGSGAATNSGG